VVIVLKSGSLNLQPPGTLKACNGIALPFTSSKRSFYSGESTFYAASQWQRHTKRRKQAVKSSYPGTYVKGKAHKSPARAIKRIW
jgi:hypothetical protein